MEPGGDNINKTWVVWGFLSHNEKAKKTLRQESEFTGPINHWKVFLLAVNI